MKFSNLRRALGHHSKNFVDSDNSLLHKDVKIPEDDLEYHEVVCIYEYENKYNIYYGEVTGCCGAETAFAIPKKNTANLRRVLDILMPVIDKQIRKTGPHFDHPLYMYMNKKINLSDHDFLVQFYDHREGCGGELIFEDLQLIDIPLEVRHRYKDNVYDH